MLKKIAIILVLVIVVFVVVVAMQSGEFRVTRSVTIAAPPAAVFAQVNDFHRWEAWSPWAKLDPAAKITYSGAPSGLGADFAWSGNDAVGEGSMRITKSNPSDEIVYTIEFTKPMQATNHGEFTFRAAGDQTLVTWSMYGSNGFIGKAFCMFMNMDKMVGGDFERGLSQMKAITEAAVKK